MNGMKVRAQSALPERANKRCVRSRTRIGGSFPAARADDLRWRVQEMLGRELTHPGDRVTVPAHVDAVLRAAGALHVVDPRVQIVRAAASRAAGARGGSADERHGLLARLDEVGDGMDVEAEAGRAHELHQGRALLPEGDEQRGALGRAPGRHPGAAVGGGGRAAADGKDVVDLLERRERAHGLRAGVRREGYEADQGRRQ
eukprot:COSAG02_NODE_4940_length_4809_cov_26.880042_7_plen_201_part_00